MVNDEKTMSYGTTYSLSAETVGTFESLCVVNSVAWAFFLLVYDIFCLSYAHYFRKIGSVIL